MALIPTAQERASQHLENLSQMSKKQLLYLCNMLEIRGQQKSTFSGTIIHQIRSKVKQIAFVSTLNIFSDTMDDFMQDARYERLDLLSNLNEAEYNLEATIDSLTSFADDAKSKDDANYALSIANHLQNVLKNPQYNNLKTLREQNDGRK